MPLPSSAWSRTTFSSRGGTTDGAAGSDGAEPAQVAAIFGRTGPRGQQPVVIVWRRPPGAAAWSLAQTLGADSLGGVGVAEFLPRADGGPGIGAGIAAELPEQEPGRLHRQQGARGRRLGVAVTELAPWTLRWAWVACPVAV
jgi:hypothetical protein